MVGEPPPPARQIANGSQDLKPSVKNGQQDKQGRFNRDAPGKAIDPKSLVLSLPGEHWSLYCETGPLQRAFKKLVDLGEYQFVARRQGYRVVDKRPKFTRLVNGKVVPHGECGDAEEDHVAIVQLQPRPIRDRLELSDLESDPTDPAKKSGAIVHRFSLIGPMMPAMHVALLAAPKELEERRNRGI